MTDPNVKMTLLVGSGKGGVGKSTVSLNLALALAARGARCGLLDADLHGPSIPLMLGIRRDEWTRYWTVVMKGRPRRLAPTERHGLKVMSFGMVLGEDQPMALEGTGLTIVVQQLCHQIDWGDLDILVVDLPPGTGDVMQTVMLGLRPARAVLVVTPQDVAHLDARKALQAYRMGSVPILGGVENMSALACPHCGQTVSIFPRVDEQRSLWRRGVERLAAIPFDPSLGTAAESGTPAILADQGSASALAFGQLAERIATLVAGDGG